MTRDDWEQPGRVKGSAGSLLLITHHQLMAGWGQLVLIRVIRGLIRDQIDATGNCTANPGSFILSALIVWEHGRMNYKDTEP